MKHRTAIKNTLHETVTPWKDYISLHDDIIDKAYQPNLFLEILNYLPRTAHTKQRRVDTPFEFKYNNILFFKRMNRECILQTRLKPERYVNVI